MTVQVNNHDFVGEIILDAPPMNLMDNDVMQEIIDKHREADAHPKTRVLVTRSAVPDMFSNGLNPGFVLKTPVEERVEIFRMVGRMFHALLALRKPHIALIQGPAMAGGAVLAATADYRLFAAEHGRICFSEPKVGLPIPAPIADAVAAVAEPRHLRDIILLGKNMDAETALQYGLADGVAANGEALDSMLNDQIGKLARLSRDVMAAGKAALRAPLIERAAAFAEDPSELALFVGNDYLGEGLRALVENRKPVFRY